jgi:hypothetical protein
MRRTGPSRVTRPLGAFIFCLLFSAAAFAQSDVGTITGFVRDPTGAVVPNAKVTIRSEATGEGHTVTTDGAGHYTVPSLLPGLYTMVAEVSGFKKLPVHITSWNRTPLWRSMRASPSVRPRKQLR